MFDDNFEGDDVYQQFMDALSAATSGPESTCPNTDCPVHYRVSKVDEGEWGERHMTYIDTHFVISERLPDSKAIRSDIALLGKVVGFTVDHLAGRTTPEQEEAVIAAMPFRVITEVYEVGEGPLGNTEHIPVTRDETSGRDVAAQHAMHCSLLMTK